MLTGQELANILRANGFKVTPQRLAVYDVLAKNEKHPNAEMIYNELRVQYPSMSFATVYKTVEILGKLGIIKVLNTGDGSARYDAMISSHAHIQCNKCGHVKNVGPLPLEKIDKKVAEETGYTVDGKQFYFYGVCKDCQTKK